MTCQDHLSNHPAHHQHPSNPPLHHLHPLCSFSLPTEEVPPGPPPSPPQLNISYALFDDMPPWRVTVESVIVESVIGVQGTTIMIDRDGSVTIDS